jgi:hypothetical protein
MTVDTRLTPPMFRHIHTHIPMAIDPTVNRVLTMITPLAMVSPATQAGLVVTPRMTALIPMTTLMIIRWPAASVQHLVVLPPLMDVGVRRRPDWTITLATSDPELTQKMQMVPRYRSGGVMYLVSPLAPVDRLFPAWVLL